MVRSVEYFKEDIAYTGVSTVFSNYGLYPRVEIEVMIADNLESLCNK